VLIVSSERPEIVDHAWTTEQVLRITGVSKRRLGYWLDRGILSADVDEARGRGRVRLWSFADLVEVRVVLWLRDRVSLQLIGRIVEHLRKRGIDQPLAELRFAVIDTGRAKRATDVVVQQPDGNWETPIEGQVVMEVVLPLVRFADELRVAAERDRAHRRQPGRFERRRGRLGSVEVLAGTRVPVAAVQRLHAAGWSAERIIENYPGLTERDVAVAVRSAAR
jgi:DNA-binding transcriptional MerR regulator